MRIQSIKRYLITSVALALSCSILSCSSVSSSQDSTIADEHDAERVAVPENRVYGIVADGYTIDHSTIKLGEAMGGILGRYGVSAHKSYEIEQAAKEVYPLNKIRGGNSYTTLLKRDSLGGDHLDYLIYNIDNSEYVVFSLLDDKVDVYREKKRVTTRRYRRTATIDSSMWGAIMEAQLPYALGAEIEDIYQWSVDFFSIQKGDKFTVIYDEKFVDDSVSIGLGQIWGAKFTHSDRDYYAIPFEQNDKLQYWEEDGGSLRKQMLKAPLKYSRISSGFSYSRYHPVYKVYKPHTGVDYAAPMGTPVHSVADGVIIFKGWGGGGGNTLKIKHAGGFTTGYLHLKGYANGIYSGAKVKQGQTIGYVGSTGTSTGPHLDYRVWKGSVPINPLKMPQEPTEPISQSNIAAFEVVKQRTMMELDGVRAIKYNSFDIKELASSVIGVDSLFAATM